MATFAYTAIDKTGRRTTGTVPADSRAAAMDAVTSQGLSPITIAEAAVGKAGGSLGLSFGKGTKVPAKQVENFTRELANLLAAGLSLSRALSLLKREVSNPAAKAAWIKIHDSVVGGESLADSMAKFPQAFSPVYLAMVRAGETGGFLHVVLQQISDFRQREQDLKAKVKAAMIYPVALASVAAAVLIFLLTFFIPRFSQIFEQFGSKLPALTRAIVAVSNLLLSPYGILAGVGIVVGVVVFKRWSATPNGSRFVERIVLKTPALGVVVARFALVRFSRMLGTLVGAGVPLVASLRVAKEAIGNRTLSDAISSAIDQVQRGTALSKALSGNPQLFPPSVIEMVSVAEETGRVDKELVRMSVTYETDLDRNLKLFVSLAEPALLIVMAALIGTVVVGMLLPVFSLQDMLN